METVNRFDAHSTMTMNEVFHVRVVKTIDIFNNDCSRIIKVAIETEFLDGPLKGQHSECVVETTNYDNENIGD